LHGDGWGAFRLHPLGPPLVVWCLLVTIFPLLPPALRRRAPWIDDPARALPRLMPVVIFALVCNGLYRLAWIYWLRRPSPW